ncbi:GntR family transcriptional regulator [Alkalihalobacillus oceani]|uniref:GntR family transcriptional regulator n=1 Tax=Halalkalibacter oceani TaxID=1653776 RepID=UPI00204032E2|nr:GntR family transcriptional regulator [Halalkalibacter oceani]
MRSSLDDNRPIFQQIREMIEEEIVAGQLQEEEKAPSTNQLVAHYKINPATVLKGINQLVDEGILYKKRGIGMFVAKGARSKLLEERRQRFKDEYVWRTVQEARKLGISVAEVQAMIQSVEEGDEKE